MPRRKPRRLPSGHALLIEQAEALGEPPEDPLLLFSVLYGFWVRELCRIQWRCDARACGAVPGARREARATVPLMIGHRLMGDSLAAHGRHRGRPRALRSGARALRSCRTSSAGDAVWPRRRGSRSCPFGHWLCGFLAIPRPRSQTPSTRSRMRARSAKPPR